MPQISPAMALPRPPRSGTARVARAPARRSTIGRARQAEVEQRQPEEDDRRGCRGPAPPSPCRCRCGCRTRGSRAAAADAAGTARDRTGTAPYGGWYGCGTADGGWLGCGGGVPSAASRAGVGGTRAAKGRSRAGRTPAGPGGRACRTGTGRSRAAVSGSDRVRSPGAAVGRDGHRAQPLRAEVDRVPPALRASCGSAGRVPAGTYTAPVSETPEADDAGNPRCPCASRRPRPAAPATTPAAIPAPPHDQLCVRRAGRRPPWPPSCAAWPLLGSTSQLQQATSIDAQQQGKTPKTPDGPRPVAARVHVVRAGHASRAPSIACARVLAFALRRVRAASGAAVGDAGSVRARSPACRSTSVPDRAVSRLRCNVAGVLVGVGIDRRDRC